MRTPLTVGTDVLHSEKWADMVHVPLSLAEDIVTSRDAEWKQELRNFIEEKDLADTPVEELIIAHFGVGNGGVTSTATTGETSSKKLDFTTSTTQKANVDDVTLCPHCNCMTHTIPNRVDGTFKCGKCKGRKEGL